MRTRFSFTDEARWGLVWQAADTRCAYTLQFLYSWLWAPETASKWETCFSSSGLKGSSSLWPGAQPSPPSIHCTFPAPSPNGSIHPSSWWHVFLTHTWANLINSDLACDSRRDNAAAVASAVFFFSLYVPSDRKHLGEASLSETASHFSSEQLSACIDRKQCNTFLHPAHSLGR